MARCIEIKNSSEKIVAGRYFGFGRTDVAESAEAIVSVRATTQETGTNLSPDIRDVIFVATGSKFWRFGAWNYSVLGTSSRE